MEAAGFEISEEPISTLSELAKISIAFEVRSTFDVSEPQTGEFGLILEERVVDQPYVKDYDVIAGEGPTRWAQRFDTSNWGLIVARSASEWLGGAVLAFNTPGVNMLEGRTDMAVLWDLRVTPSARGKGVGAALFRAAEHWAQSRGCKELKVETQNTNVPACRFYKRQGCVLGSIEKFGYADIPDEVRLIWRKKIT